MEHVPRFPQQRLRARAGHQSSALPHAHAAALGRPRACRYSVTSRPATSARTIACCSANPSYTGTANVTPSPESSTTPVVAPDAYSASVACGDTNRAGTRNFSKKISAAAMRCEVGFSGASVNKTWPHQRANNTPVVGQPCTIPRRTRAGGLRWWGAHRVFVRAHAQAVLAQRVAPDRLHVLPVRHDTVLHRVRQPKRPAVPVRTLANKPAHAASAARHGGVSRPPPPAPGHARPPARWRCSCPRAAAAAAHMSPSRAPPAMQRGCFGRPTHALYTSCGLSSPANPAFITPVPLSSTIGRPDMMALGPPTQLSAQCSDATGGDVRLSTRPAVQISMPWRSTIPKCLPVCTQFALAERCALAPTGQCAAVRAHAVVMYRGVSCTMP